MGSPTAIAHPRRILAVALEGEAELLGRLVKDLTGAAPAAPSGASFLAGTTHALPLTTAYYTAAVPVWLDLVGTPPSAWAAAFLAAEARDVLAALGGVVAVFALPPPLPPPPPSSSRARELVAAVGRVVRDGLGGRAAWDGVGLAVGVVGGGGGGGGAAAAPPPPPPHPDDLDAWDEACGEAGLEFVCVAAGASAAADTRNEFGEKVGMPRVREALEANDWAAAPSTGAGDGSGGGDAELDPDNLDFGLDRDDVQGLTKAIWEARTAREEDGLGEAGDEEAGQLGDDDVEKVEQMMRKLQAVRDMGAGLPEEQRKRLAARAVGEVMRDL